MLWLWQRWWKNYIRNEKKSFNGEYKFTSKTYLSLVHCNKVIYNFVQCTYTQTLKGLLFTTLTVIATAFTFWQKLVVLWMFESRTHFVSSMLGLLWSRNKSYIQTPWVNCSLWKWVNDVLNYTKYFVCIASSPYTMKTTKESTNFILKSCLRWLKCERPCLK